MATRFSTLPNDDNTGRVLTFDYKKPLYAAVISVALNAGRSFIKPALLTGPVTFNAVTTRNFECDEVTFILTSDTTSRTVTFGTNFVTAGTISPAISKQATITFVFDGFNWIEKCRAVQA